MLIQGPLGDEEVLNQALGDVGNMITGWGGSEAGQDWLDLSDVRCEARRVSGRVCPAQPVLFGRWVWRTERPPQL